MKNAELESEGVDVNFLNHLCDEELYDNTVLRCAYFLNHLCDEEPDGTTQAFWREFLNHLCDEELSGA